MADMEGRRTRPTSATLTLESEVGDRALTEIGQGMAEEARELEKKTRAIDSARRNYIEESQRIISQQQDAINKLKQENSSLKTDLDKEAEINAAAPNAMEISRINQLKDLVENYSRKIEIEQRKVEEHNKDIEVTETKVLHLRKRVGGANGARDNTIQLERMSSILENRLEKAHVKYNKLLNQNKKLRDDIDHLRKERVMFENIYKKLEEELHDKKLDLSSRIELSNVAYEARDQALAEMAAIRAESDAEQTQFEIEMARLGARLGAGRRDRDAAMRNLLYSSVQSLSHLKDSEAHAATPGLDNYEEVFERLRKVPGGDALPGDVVTHFIEKEDANLTLFNYVNNLRSEVQRLEEGAADLEAEMRQVKSRGALENGSGQRKEIVSELQQERDTLVLRASTVTAKTSETRQAVALVASMAQQILEKVGANPGSSSSTEQEDDQVGRAQELLGIVEQRANEITTMWSAYQTARNRTQAPAAGGAAQPKSQASTLQVVAPSIDIAGDDSDSEGSDFEMPMTSNQLKFKVAEESGASYRNFIEKESGRTLPGSAGSAAKPSAGTDRQSAKSGAPATNASAAPTGRGSRPASAASQRKIPVSATGSAGQVVGRTTSEKSAGGVWK